MAAILDERKLRHVLAMMLDVPSMQRSEVVGLVAGFGTTFAAMPDLLAMLKRRSPIAYRQQAIEIAYKQLPRNAQNGGLPSAPVT